MRSPPTAPRSSMRPSRRELPIRDCSFTAWTVSRQRRFPTQSVRRIPFFSPDGQWVGFVKGSALRRVSLETGAVATVHEGIELFRGASWAIDDSIVFSDLTKGLLRVPATGGEPESLAARDDRGLHRFPHVLPDGKAVLFTVWSGRSGEIGVAFARYRRLAHLGRRRHRSEVRDCRPDRLR